MKKINIYISNGYYKFRKNGKVLFYHRYIMEQHLNRKLLKTEIVHHINGNPLDNRSENLQLMNRSEHMSYHLINSKLVKCDNCGKYITRTPYRLKINKKQFCGLKCHNEFQINKSPSKKTKIKMTQSQIKRWKTYHQTNKIITIGTCCVCKKKFKRKPYELKLRKKHFCNNACRFIYIRKNHDKQFRPEPC